MSSILLVPQDVVQLVLSWVIDGLQRNSIWQRPPPAAIQHIFGIVADPPFTQSSHRSSPSVTPSMSLLLSHNESCLAEPIAVPPNTHRCTLYPPSATSVYDPQTLLHHIDNLHR
ncbi:hypothetical protein K438DRAFT_2012645 [Mycena galopus ATCC 62051]|nr:hypothetical protein K438DRAFT_2012645 [Mycena galopus ATCC 62051]